MWKEYMQLETMRQMEQHAREYSRKSVILNISLWSEEFENL